MKRAAEKRREAAKEEKRARKERAAAATGSPLNEDNFSPGRVAELKASYAASGPYPHVVVSGLCEDSRARAIEFEARTTLRGDFKETDLFKVRGGADWMTGLLPSTLAK